MGGRRDWLWVGAVGWVLVVYGKAGLVEWSVGRGKLVVGGGVVTAGWKRWEAMGSDGKRWEAMGSDGFGGGERGWRGSLQVVCGALWLMELVGWSVESVVLVMSVGGG